jgi:uncharacterized protein YuzE
MKLTYSPRGRVAYLSLRNDEDSPRVATNQIVKPPDAEHADDRIILDFDQDGRLVGIEFLTPDDRLLPSIVEDAQRASG